MKSVKKISAGTLARIIKEVAGAQSAGQLMSEIRDHYAIIKDLAAQLEYAPDLREFLEDYSMMGFEEGDEMLAPVASELVALTEEVWSALNRDLRDDIRELS